MTKESNGVKVTINDVRFDGRTIIITYSIESEKRFRRETVPIWKSASYGL